jgi:Ca2+-binding RTX toxin-like protein
MRMFLALVIASVLGAILSPAAVAGTVAVNAVDNGAGLIFRAAPGEANRVTISMADGGQAWSVTDTGAPLTAVAPCTSVDANAASCPVPDTQEPGGHVDHGFYVTLGDGDDWASVADSCGLAECDSRVDGGSGNDTLIGDRSLADDSQLFGRSGNDRLLQGSFVDGGSGADTLRGGLAYYGARRGPVFVSLNGVRDDGAAGENDFVATESVEGGAGDDILSGNSQANFLIARAGSDVVRGGLGTDFLEGGAGADRLIGGAGADTVFGQSGRDRITGSAGRDQLLGGLGNDVFFARDGFRDQVAGQTGTDRARIDRGLDRRSSIERLF